MKYYVYVEVKVVKQLVVEGLTEEQICEDRDTDIWEYVTDEVETERTDDWSILDVRPLGPGPLEPDPRAPSPTEPEAGTAHQPGQRDPGNVG